MEKISNNRGIIKKNNIDLIAQLALNNNGYITSSMITKNNIHRGYLKEMINDKKIKKITRGVYIVTNNEIDELYALQLRYPKIIYSELTALYLHNYIDKMSSKYDITVNSNYHAKILEHTYHLVKCYPNILELGLIKIKTKYGKEVNCYDIERCICDLIKFKKRIDFKVIKKVINKYMKERPNLDKLYDYAIKLRVSKELKRIIKLYVEV